MNGITNYQNGYHHHDIVCLLRLNYKVNESCNIAAYEKSTPTAPAFIGSKGDG